MINFDFDKINLQHQELSARRLEEKCLEHEKGADGRVREEEGTLRD